VNGASGAAAVMILPFKSIYAGQEQNEKGINGNYFKHYISHILATTSTKTNQ